MKKILLVLGLFLSFTFLYAQEGKEIPSLEKTKGVPGQVLIPQTLQQGTTITTPPAPTQRGILTDDVEEHTAFTLNSPGPLGWSYYNGNPVGTYGMNAVSWPNIYATMAYMVFKPSATAPPLAASYNPHSGLQYFASFACTTGINDAWMISPLITVESNATISFWARALDATYPERFKVLISTSGDSPSNFTTAISPGSYVQTSSVTWTQYTYNIPNNAKYVAIVCVSDDAFALLIDDIAISGVQAYVPEAPTISLASPISFGTVYNNAPIVYSQEVTVSNKGAQPLTISLSNVSPELTVTGFPVTIPALSSHTINVTLANTALPPGAYNGSFKLTTNDPDKPTLNVAVTATVQSADIRCSINENFNSGVWPAGWLQAGSFSAQTTGGVGNTGCVRSNLYSSNTLGALRAPLVFMGNNPQLSFYYNALNYTGGAAAASGCLTYYVFISTDFGGTFTQVLQGSHVSSTNFVKIEADVSAYANKIAMVQVEFVWISGDYYVRVDDFIAGSALDNDLAISAFTGNLTPLATKPENYSVTVKNLGTQPVNSYTVSVLAADNTVLGTQSVTTPLAVNATNTIVFPITFPQSQAGPVAIKAVATYNGDECSVNNAAWLSLNVKPHPGYDLDCVNKQVGTGTTTNSNNVANLYYYQSYSQQIYDAADIGAAGLINSIAFDYGFTTAYSFTRWDIYMQNIPDGQTFTSTTNWKPVTAADLVYSGPFNVTTAGAKVKSEFPVPFVYTGGSILVTVHRPVGVNQYVGSSSSPFWRGTNTTDYKALGHGADGAVYNLAGPTQAGTRSYTRPNALFEICSKLYTLNPNDIYEEGSVVTVTSTPYPVPAGGSISISISCDDPCRYISEVIIGGQSIVPIPSTYTFSNIQDILPLIHVKTEYVQIPITVSAGPTGTGVIDPPNAASGVHNVNCGFNQKFNFVPSLGYVVKYFEVDGVLQPKAGSYTFTNVTAPHTIHVEFKEAPYKIVFTHVGNGQVIPVGKENEIPNGQIGLDDGDMQQFLFIPDPNCVIQAVYIDGVLNMGATISGSYMFINVHENHTVHVIFKLIDKYILATTGPNGTINPTGNVPVPYGTCKEFTITANTGYVINQIFIDGNLLEGLADQLAVFQYTFCDVIENHTIYVTFKAATWQIAVSWDACGSSMLSPAGINGIISLPHNAIQKINFVPDEGCEVVQVLIDGVPYPAAIPTGSYTFYYLTENHTIHVTFAKIKYPVKATINDHGVIEPNGINMVAHGDDMTFEYYTFPGYKVVNVFIDGIDYTPAVATGTYTFEKVKAPHYIDVITAPIVHKISAVAETGGFITPAGEIAVGYGQNQMFTFTAVPGYEIEYVYIDGVINMEAVVNGSYAFLNVKADHTIKVTFKMSRYSLLAVPPTNGLIEPAGVTQVTYFDEITYTITPNEGYKISYVMINGTNMGEINAFTFSEVEADGSIEAFFTLVGPGDPDVIDPYELGISIYSNGNTVYIANKDLTPITNVSIFDMYGRVVWQGNVYDTLNPIPLKVSTGIYSVRVTTEAGFTTTKVNIVR